MTAAAYRRLLHAATVEKSVLRDIIAVAARALYGDAGESEANMAAVRRGLAAAIECATKMGEEVLLADKATEKEIQAMRSRINELLAQVKELEDRNENQRNYNRNLSEELEEIKRDEPNRSVHANAYRSLQHRAPGFAYKLQEARFMLDALHVGLAPESGYSGNPCAAKIVMHVTQRLRSVTDELVEALGMTPATCVPKKTV